MTNVAKLFGKSNDLSDLEIGWDNCHRVGFGDNLSIYGILANVCG